MKALFQGLRLCLFSNQLPLQYRPGSMGEERKRGRTQMRKFDGLLLVSDFDDTLYDHQRRIPQRNIQALRYFLSEGGRFTVATGRAWRTFSPYAQLAPINAPVVLSNGSALYDFQKGRMLKQTFLPLSAPEDLSAVLDQFPTLALEAYFGEDVYVHRPSPITWSHLEKVGVPCTQLPPARVPLPWTKAMLQEEPGLLRQARDWFLSRYGWGYEAIFSNPYYLEITRKGSTKGDMVAEVARMLDIAPEHIYCVGDNQNDIPMLEHSAIPFAPSNCAREVREWGARVLCHCDDVVIGDIVEILDRLYP